MCFALLITQGIVLASGPAMLTVQWEAHQKMFPIQPKVGFHVNVSSNIYRC